MVSTLSGMVTDMIPLQFMKAQLPMRVTPPLKFIDLTLEHPSNAESPITLVLTGMEMETSPLHPSNALERMVLTVLGTSRTPAMLLGALMTSVTLESYRIPCRSER